MAPWPEEPPVDRDAWRQSVCHCRAIDLFDAGYYWEAHEGWEHVWHGLGRTGEDADFFKGLIHLAAAGVKSRQGIANGVSRHSAKAAALFRKVVGGKEQAHLFGLSANDMIALAERLARSPTVCPAGVDDMPTPVLGALPRTGDG